MRVIESFKHWIEWLIPVQRKSILTRRETLHKKGRTCKRCIFFIKEVLINCAFVWLRLATVSCDILLGESLIKTIHIKGYPFKSIHLVYYVLISPNIYMGESFEGGSQWESTDILRNMPSNRDYVHREKIFTICDLITICTQQTFRMKYTENIRIYSPRWMCIYIRMCTIVDNTWCITIILCAWVLTHSPVNFRLPVKHNSGSIVTFVITYDKVLSVPCGSRRVRRFSRRDSTKDRRPPCINFGLSIKRIDKVAVDGSTEDFNVSRICRQTAR